MPRRPKDAPLKSRGRQSAFSAEALAFLESWYPGYASTRGKSRAPFWSNFLAAWYLKYPSMLNSNSSEDASTAEEPVIPSATPVPEVTNTDTAPSGSEPAVDSQPGPDILVEAETGDGGVSNTGTDMAVDSASATTSTAGVVVDFHAQRVTRQTLEKWFSNRSTKEKRSRNPFDHYIKNVSAAVSKPRYKAPYQLYQSYPEFSAKVDEEYKRQLAEGLNEDSIDDEEAQSVKPGVEPDAQCSAGASAELVGVQVDGEPAQSAPKDKGKEKEPQEGERTESASISAANATSDTQPQNTRGKRLTTRNAIARSLLETESDEVKAQIHQAREELYAKDTLQYNDTVNGKSLDEPSLVPLRREQVVTIAQPLADALSIMIQGKVVILCGNIDDVGQSAAGVNELWLAEIESIGGSGVQARSFSETNPISFKDVFVKAFVDFLKVAKRNELGLPVLFENPVAPTNELLAGLLAFPPQNPVASEPSSSIGAATATSLDTLTTATTAMPSSEAVSQKKGKRKRARSTTPEDTPEPSEDTPEPSEDECWDASSVHRTPSPPPTRDYYPSTPELPDGVRSGLQQVLRGMEKQDRRAKIAQLRGMGDYELSRENRIAENKLLMQSMGLDNDIRSLFSTGATPQEQPNLSLDAGTTVEGGPDRNIHQERPRPKPKPLVPSSRTLRSKDQPSTKPKAPERSGDGTQPQQQEPDEPTDRQENEEDAQGNKEDGSEPESVELPTWLSKVESQLLDGLEAPAWQECWDSLVALEELYGFINPTRGLTKKLRPDAVSWWSGRGRNKFPSILEAADSSTFKLSVTEYWRSINPEWRIGSDGQLSQNGNGSWTALRLPGANGLLSIVACLRWWYDLEDVEGGSSEWLDAVSDVTWALQAMRESFLSGDDEEEEEEEEEGELENGEPVNKKSRTS